MSQSTSDPNRRGGRPPAGRCQADEYCPEPWHARKLCVKHYQRWRRHRATEAEAGRARYGMRTPELIRLRRMVGVPENGPTRSMKLRWARQEAQS